MIPTTRKNSFFIFLQKSEKCISRPSNFTSIYFGGSSRLDTIILTGIILKGVINFELKLFQIDNFLSEN
jgi:hypothetical protein